MRFLPKFLRQLIALLRAWTSPEYGGMVHDYANGKWEQLHFWQTDEGLKEAAAMTQAMVNGSRDLIYIVTVKCGPGPGKGYFMIYGTGRRVVVRPFWPGVYDFNEALRDVYIKARKIADEMGFRRPDDTVGRI